jgi:hypothetical protein
MAEKKVCDVHRILIVSDTCFLLLSLDGAHYRFIIANRWRVMWVQLIPTTFKNFLIGEALSRNYLSLDFSAMLNYDFKCIISDGCILYNRA